jgi:hypothetical protein
MEVPTHLRKVAVIINAVLLGFVVCITAVSTLGSNAKATFTFVGSRMSAPAPQAPTGKPKSTTPAIVDPAPDTADATPPALSQPSTPSK